MLAVLMSKSPDLGGERVMVCALGRDAGTVAGLARELAEHGGDPEAAGVVTCDLSPAFAKGVSEHLPNAERDDGRFHVTRLATRQLDRVRSAEARESRERGALLARTKYIWPGREASPAEGQAERRRTLSREHLRTARACATREAPRAACDCGARDDAGSGPDALRGWIMHSNVPRTRTVARTIREHRAEIPDHSGHRPANAVPGGTSSAVQSAKRQARGLGNLEYLETIVYPRLGKLRFSPDVPLCHPLKTARSQNYTDHCVVHPCPIGRCMVGVFGKRVQ